MTGLDPQASYTLKELMKEHSKREIQSFFLDSRIRSSRKDM